MSKDVKYLGSEIERRALSMLIVFVAEIGPCGIAPANLELRDLSAPHASACQLLGLLMNLNYFRNLNILLMEKQLLNIKTRIGSVPLFI